MSEAQGHSPRTAFHDLPEPMRAEYRNYPDWSINLSFADTLVWLANRLAAGAPKEITANWLRVEAGRTYDMAQEQWEEEGLYA